MSDYGRVRMVSEDAAQWWLPLAAFMVLSTLLLGLRGDLWLADHVYAWVALFFCFVAVKAVWRRRGLAVGIGVGLLFGIDQQLRGAHFLSHDLFTAMICWSVALGLYRLMFRPSGTRGGA